MTETMSSRTGSRITINREARELFLDFAISPHALWTANFRDLGGAVTRMATLAPNGRTTVREVREEIQCLQGRWQSIAENRWESQMLPEVIGNQKADQLDLFDQVTLDKVIAVCRSSATIADAGRTLFGKSRLKKRTQNDSDRLRKYLAKFDLDWQQVSR